MLFLLLFVSVLSRDVLLGSASIIQTSDAIEEKLNFQFYYEILCPWCKQEFIDDLVPIYKDLGPYLDITLLPYGNADMDLKGTQLKISCQHGDDECYGNMLQGCAVDIINDVNTYIPFNGCMMNLHNSSYTNDGSADACGKKFKIDAEPIKQCAKGIRGFQILLANGIASEKEKLPGVPWWNINGKRRDVNDRRPLREILCTSFKKPPPVCSA